MRMTTAPVSDYLPSACIACFTVSVRVSREEKTFGVGPMLRTSFSQEKMLNFKLSISTD